MMCALVIMLNVGTEGSPERKEKKEQERNRQYAELLNKIWDEENVHDPVLIHRQLKALFDEEVKLVNGMENNAGLADGSSE